MATKASRMPGRFGASGEPPKIALVVWSGELGGAEIWSGALSRHMRRLGIDATVVALTKANPLADRLRLMGVPCRELGLARGSAVMRHPRRYAQLLSSTGADGAILMTAGYMATALRVGGFRPPVVAVEHGYVLDLLARPRRRQCAQRLDLAIGSRLITAQVAVSSFMLAELRKVPHCVNARTIPNGVDTEEFCPSHPIFRSGRAPVVGWAGRMVQGKGVDDLLHAVALAAGATAFDLQLAGDGPERPRLEELAVALGVAKRVRFVGRRHDMATFWNECDLAAATSSTFIESFGMAPLEASSCGRPVVATRNGGFPDIVVDGVTGHLVNPGNIREIAAALQAYTRDVHHARAHGAAARDRAVKHFGIGSCADSYIRLLRDCGARL